VKERGKLKRNISRRVMKDACVSEWRHMHNF
jgi:hypothetical protein